MSGSQNKYTALISPEHAGKPNFVASVYAATQPFVDVQSFLYSLIASFDLDTAIGVQLDAIGLRVGAPRNINVINEGVVTLTDDQYRLYIRAKIAANTWDGTVPGAKAIYDNIFPGLLVFIQDNQDMSMLVGISGQLPDYLTETLLLYGYLPLKPAGVQETNIITSQNNTPIFGLDMENQYVSGFDVGSADIIIGTS